MPKRKAPKSTPVQNVAPVKSLYQNPEVDLRRFPELDSSAASAFLRTSSDRKVFGRLDVIDFRYENGRFKGEDNCNAGKTDILRKNLKSLPSNQIYVALLRLGHTLVGPEILAYLKGNPVHRVEIKFDNGFHGIFGFNSVLFLDSNYMSTGPEIDLASISLDHMTANIAFAAEVTVSPKIDLKSELMFSRKKTPNPNPTPESTSPPAPLPKWRSPYRSSKKDLQTFPKLTSRGASAFLRVTNICRQLVGDSDNRTYYYNGSHFRVSNFDKLNTSVKNLKRLPSNQTYTVPLGEGITLFGPEIVAYLKMNPRHRVEILCGNGFRGIFGFENRLFYDQSTPFTGGIVDISTISLVHGVAKIVQDADLDTVPVVEYVKADEAEVWLRQYGVNDINLECRSMLDNKGLKWHFDCDLNMFKSHKLLFEFLPSHKVYAPILNKGTVLLRDEILPYLQKHSARRVSIGRGTNGLSYRYFQGKLYEHKCKTRKSYNPEWKVISVETFNSHSNVNFAEISDSTFEMPVFKDSKMALSTVITEEVASPKTEYVDTKTAEAWLKKRRAVNPDLTVRAVFDVNGEAWSYSSNSNKFMKGSDYSISDRLPPGFYIISLKTGTDLIGDEILSYLKKYEGHRVSTGHGSDTRTYKFVNGKFYELSLQPDLKSRWKVVPASTFKPKLSQSVAYISDSQFKLPISKETPMPKNTEVKLSDFNAKEAEAFLSRFPTKKRRRAVTDSKGSVWFYSNTDCKFRTTRNLSETSELPSERKYEPLFNPGMVLMDDEVLPYLKASSLRLVTVEKTTGKCYYRMINSELQIFKHEKNAVWTAVPESHFKDDVRSKYAAKISPFVLNSAKDPVKTSDDVKPSPSVPTAQTSSLDFYMDAKAATAWLRKFPNSDLGRSVLDQRAETWVIRDGEIKLKNFEKVRTYTELPPGKYVPILKIGRLLTRDEVIPYLSLDASHRVCLKLSPTDYSKTRFFRFCTVYGLMYSAKTESGFYLSWMPTEDLGNGIYLNPAREAEIVYEIAQPQLSYNEYGNISPIANLPSTMPTIDESFGLEDYMPLRSSVGSRGFPSNSKVDVLFSRGIIRLQNEVAHLMARNAQLEAKASFDPNTTLEMVDIIPALLKGHVLIEQHEDGGKDPKTSFWRWIDSAFESCKLDSPSDTWTEDFPTIDPGAIWKVFI